jgi:phosphotransferase system  glucose/maltose/N-acetylglucosamine-specific IIC component
MRSALLVTLLTAGIILGFFLLACSLVLVGLSFYRMMTEGIDAGGHLIVNAWPLFVASAISIAVGAYALRSTWLTARLRNCGELTKRNV